jgi:hypothetical protein
VAEVTDASLPQPTRGGHGVAMKPSREYSLSQSGARPGSGTSNGSLYGIFDGWLNYSMHLMFVPAFPREPWPPTPAENADELHSEQEARSNTVARSCYTVTPDDSRRERKTRLRSSGCNLIRVRLFSST